MKGKIPLSRSMPIKPITWYFQPAQFYLNQVFIHLALHYSFDFSANTLSHCFLHQHSEGKKSRLLCAVDLWKMFIWAENGFLARVPEWHHPRHAHRHWPGVRDSLMLMWFSCYLPIYTGSVLSGLIVDRLKKEIKQLGGGGVADNAPGNCYLNVSQKTLDSSL